LNKQRFTEDYYDRVWTKIFASISPPEEERIKKILSLIPEDCSSILDVGCGDGRITNRLISKHRQIVGLERSREALRYVKTENILGSIDYLPFRKKSFTLILCAEVLEHLPFEVYPNALKEIQRVAAKYILITVPNSENRKLNFVTCPQCGCVFHSWRHLRSFIPERMSELFAQFEVQKLQLCQSPVKLYPISLLRLAKLIRLIPDFPATALCPQCGYTILPASEIIHRVNTIKQRNRLIHFLADCMKRLLPTRKNRGWLIALYIRKTNI